MIYRIPDVKTRKAQSASIPEDLIQAREIQAHIRDNFTEATLPKNSLPSRVEIAPGGVLVQVIRWIE
jgi:hypothetical protein